MITRFCKQLGYNGYKELQWEVQNTLSQRSSLAEYVEVKICLQDMGVYSGLMVITVIDVGKNNVAAFRAEPYLGKMNER